MSTVRAKEGRLRKSPDAPGYSGAYAVQGKDDPYVQVIDGSISNVIGLPMETLAQVLELLQERE